jgi:hypothetical protein
MWVDVRTECLGEYLDVTRGKQQEAGEDCIMRSFAYSRRMGCARHVSCREEMRNEYTVLVRKPET